ncbi:MAG: type II toxin-antitoxin system RelE/ParE family toxin [Lentimicrobiaceae bacterium]|nr:type II toxin-antitoxin system RelE/ParE family toxin [Lentimicrobiaceae bacterium]MCL2132620.1 type II toxin-antitoxin system RelE/ParE family toxin [Lentimicrobiaceae bacterium]
MEKEITCKPYVTSVKFRESRSEVYYYGLRTFGYFQAEHYNQKIEDAIETLSDFYMVYPECRHIATKNQKYRNIILDSHLIIYRITDERIEVLDIVHSASNIGKIRGTRKIHI